MGMGEPLLNLDAVLAACERLPDIGIASASTAISTVGWIPGIERLAREGPPVRLALSLHARRRGAALGADAGERALPARRRARRLPRAGTSAAAATVFVEYLMLDGVNDRYEQAVRAGRRCSQPRQAFKVNLIPYNPTDAGFDGSSRGAIAAFRAALEERGVRATVRLTRGRDIDAACGQLAGRG